MSIIKNMWPRFKRMLSRKQISKVCLDHNINFADIQNDFLLLDKVFARSGLVYAETEDAFSIKEAGSVDRYTQVHVIATSDIDSLYALDRACMKYRSSKLGRMTCIDKKYNSIQIEYISYHSMFYYTISVSKIEDSSNYLVAACVYTMVPKAGQSYIETLLKFSNSWPVSGEGQRIIKQSIRRIERIQNDKIQLEDDLVYLT